MNYLPDGAYEQVMSDRFVIEGRADDGSLIAQGMGGDSERIAATQWKIASHNSSEYGKSLLREFVPGREFPFPKSLYAVEDTLRFFVLDNPHALVVDFFAGSGTTTHAVMRLNRQDGGRRRSIIVTNNEVSPDEQKSLRKQGLFPEIPSGKPSASASTSPSRVSRPPLRARRGTVSRLRVPTNSSTRSR